VFGVVVTSTTEHRAAWLDEAASLAVECFGSGTVVRGEEGEMPRWESAEQMWAAFRAARGVGEDVRYEAWHFCDNKADADELAQLVVSGVKRATAGALSAYEADGDPIPEIGDFSVITDWEGRPRAIIEATAVEVVPFRDVTADFAATEGEGDGSLEYWRRVHWAAFSRELVTLGREVDEHMLVVCERFDVVFTDASAGEE
jgi:uncharacterized protein YhfF